MSGHRTTASSKPHRRLCSPSGVLVYAGERVSAGTRVLGGCSSNQPPQNLGRRGGCGNRTTLIRWLKLFRVQSPAPNLCLLSVVGQHVSLWHWKSWFESISRYQVTVRCQNGYGTVCKTVLCGFDSHPDLQYASVVQLVETLA